MRIFRDGSIVTCMALALVAQVASPARAAGDAAVENATAAASAHHTSPPAWRLVPTGSTQQFRGLAAVSRKVAWLAGSSGTVLRTSDGGRHWLDVSPPGASALEFRDIEAWDSRHAVALTIGPGAESRVYRTSDGGATWQLTFTNDDPNAFYDCMAFFNPHDGLALERSGGRQVPAYRDA